MISVGGSLVFVFLAVRYFKLGCVFIGIWGGISLSYVLNILIFTRIGDETIPEFVLLVCATLGGIFALCYTEYTLIIASSLAGPSLLLTVYFISDNVGYKLVLQR